MSGPRLSLLREPALWAGAATVVLAAHLGGGLWVAQNAQASAPPGLPEAVFVELAPMPTAAAPEGEEEQEEAEETIKSQEEPEPEPEPQPEPLPDMKSLLPPPSDAVVLPKTARANERPKPPKEKLVEVPREKKPEKEPEKKKKPAKKVADEEQAAKKATTQLVAPKGDRTAAPQGQAGAPSKKQVASWQSKVQAAVGRHMNRARISARGRGSILVTVRFTVDPSGRVGGATLASSTGDAKLDAVLSRQAARLPRLPAPPSGNSTPLELPVQINLR